MKKNQVKKKENLCAKNVGLSLSGFDVERDTSCIVLIWN